jgi:predicted nucleotidyltransferase
MDPLTLFALANGAVQAVKKGCELYKEIASAAGDVKGVLKDLEDQFNLRHKDSPPSVAEKNQFIQEKNRVIELSKQQPNDIYTQIGEELGVYFENYAKCSAIFEEEEKHANEVYTGEASLGKRALQRVLMQSRLTAMEAELRELMVYNCPPELGDLYTRVYAMMEKMKKEQSVAWAKKRAADKIAEAYRRKRLNRIRCEAWKYGIGFVLTVYLVWLVWAIVQVRIDVSPELGRCLIPKGTWPYQHYNNLKWVDCEIKNPKGKL